MSIATLNNTIIQKVKDWTNSKFLSKPSVQGVDGNLPKYDNAGQLIDSDVAITAVPKVFVDTASPTDNGVGKDGDLYIVVDGEVEP